MRRLAGSRLNRITRRLAKKGVMAIAVVRLLPIAPFSVVNAVAGASHIRLRDFMLGTALGMAPGIIVTVIFVDRVDGGGDGSRARHDRRCVAASSALIVAAALSTCTAASRAAPRRAIRQVDSVARERHHGSRRTTRTAASAATATSCPKRIADVLQEIDADVIALQEVENRATGFDMLALSRSRRPASRRSPGRRCCARAPITATGCSPVSSVLSTQRIDLCVERCEPRGALDVELDCGGTPMRVLATHLGLRPSERREQIQRLLRALESDRPLPTILMGDINEWFLWGRPLRWMHKHFEQTPSPPTFPVVLSGVRARPHVGEAAHAAERHRRALDAARARRLGSSAAHGGARPALRRRRRRRPVETPTYDRVIRTPNSVP